MKAGQGEEGFAAEGDPADRGGDDRAEHDDAEGAGLEVAQDQLEGEEDAGDRRVEGGGDAAGGAAGDEQPHLLARRGGVSCPSAEPIAEPIWTIGPSRPTEPPEPMQSAEASDLTSGTRPRILPSLLCTASITSGTPCPRASGAKR